MALAEELHFGRAAQRLHLTQPPLTQRLKILEESLGVLLINRTTRTVELTAAGKVLLKHTRSLFKMLEVLEHEVNMTAAGQFGSLRIGFVPSAAYVLLPKLLSRYRECFPCVDIQLEEMPYLRILEQLRTGAIDLALLRLPSMEKSLESHIALSEPLIFAIPRNHPLATRKAIPLAKAHGQDFIAFSVTDSPYFSERIRYILQKAGAQPRIVQYSLLPTILSFVEAGLGIAIVPASVSRINSPNVIYKQITDLQPQDHVELIASWQRTNPSPLLVNLIEIVEQCAQDPN